MVVYRAVPIVMLLAQAIIRRHRRFLIESIFSNKSTRKIVQGFLKEPEEIMIDLILVSSNIIVRAAARYCDCDDGS